MLYSHLASAHTASRANLRRASDVPNPAAVGFIVASLQIRTQFTFSAGGWRARGERRAGELITRACRCKWSPLSRGLHRGFLCARKSGSIIIRRGKRLARKHLRKLHTAQIFALEHNMSFFFTSRFSTEREKKMSRCRARFLFRRPGAH
jgi:hypothetical protein